MHSHHIFNDLNDFYDALELAKVASFEDATLTNYWNRANAVAAHIKTALDQADPLLVMTNVLNNLANFVRNAKNEINNFASKKNKAHWSSAQSHLDNCITQAAAIPRQSVAGIGNMGEAATRYSEAASDYLEKIRKGYDETHKMQEHLQRQIADAEKEILTFS